MAANYPSTQWGITAPQFRHPSTPRSNLTINAKEDDKPVLIQSRDFAQASGTSIGFQCKPNQAVTGTTSVHGFEVQPRFADGVGGKDLVGGNISAVLKGTTGNLSGEVHTLELETDFTAGSNPTRTITGDVSIINVGADFPLSMTFADKNLINIKTMNSGGFTYFLKSADANPGFVAASAGAGAGKYLVINLGSTVYKIALLATA